MQITGYNRNMNSKYIIIKPDEYCGMCGCIWQVIRAIFHNPNKLYYIDFTDSIYNTKKNDNVWDYFFEQPHKNTFPSSDEIENFVGLISNQDSEFIWTNTVPNTVEEISKRRFIFHNIIKNFIKIKPEIEEKINKFVSLNFDNKKILGAHFRGTDHPYKKNMDEYFKIIDKVINEYDYIFVSSDSNERYEAAKKYYGTKLISYSALRSDKDDTPLHMPWYERRWKRNPTFEYQYKIAQDVIVEAYLLSKVNFLFCCPGSNVNYFARSLNPFLESVEIL
jgi:hypothetical protein